MTRIIATRPPRPEPPKVPPPNYVTLELTAEEARALSIVLGKVGGDPAGTRGLINNIYHALEEVGLVVHYLESMRKCRGTLTFNDEEEE